MWNGMERRLPTNVYFRGINRRRSSSPQRRESETAAPDYTPGTVYDTSSSCSNDSSPSYDSSPSTDSSPGFDGGGGGFDGGGASSD